MTLAFLLLGCVGGDDTKTDDTAPVDDTSGETDTPACAEVASGDDWAWTGECPQMRTPCDIVVTECELVIDYDADGGMTMGMPHGGAAAGDTVTFTDDSTVTGCVGTILSADEIEGTCDDGCTFTLRR